MSPRTLPSGTTLQVVTQPKRAGIYGRASSDPKKRGRSIKDQFAVAELDCEEQGFQVVGYYEDRDRSASRRARKTREDYERLVGDVESGLIDVIVYAERSRANRSMDAFVKLRQLCADTGVLLCYGGRVYDMRKPADRKEATRDALASEEEAETIIERAERTARLNARRGAPHGKIPFGYTRRYDPEDGHLVGQFAHPVHADVVRDLFDRAAAHEPINALVNKLREFVPDAGRMGMRYILKNRTYLGIRRHHGEDMPECQWPALVAEDVFNAVQVILNDPSRRTQRDSRIRHLLSGLASCGICIADGKRHADSTLRVHAANDLPRYRCSSARHVVARKDQLDAFVEAAVFRFLSSKAAVAVFVGQSADGEVERLRLRIANMQAQVDEAKEMAATFSEDGVPLLSMRALADTEQRVLPLIAQSEEKLASLTAVADPLLARLVGASLEDVSLCWNEEMDMPQRRHVLRHVVNVTLLQARARGVKSLGSDRVRLVFAGEEGFVPRSKQGTQGWVKEGFTGS